MRNNVYLYYYNDYFQLVEYIKRYKINNIKWEKKFDEFILELDEVNDIKIIVFKEINVVAIICNRYKDIKFLNLNNKYIKVNLFEKSFFNLLVNKKFFQNLCRIIVDIDILGDDEELVEFSGYNMMNLDIIESFGVSDIASSSKIKLYSVQPDGYENLINFKSTNKIEFSKKYNENEIDEIIYKLISIINVWISGEME